MPKEDSDVSVWNRVISASIGAIMTSLLVTPLDVAKIRMQVQSVSNCDGVICDICDDEGTLKNNKTPQQSAPKSAPSNVKIRLNVNNAAQNMSTSSIINVSKVNSNYYMFHNGLMEHQLPTSRLQIEVVESQCKHRPFKHSLDAFYKIARYEGVHHLYTGLGVTLWMAAPATVLYYSTYDMLRNRFLKYVQNNGNPSPVLSNLCPMICGISGRMFAVTVISPLELIRTQMMARTIQRDVGILQGMKLNLSDGGFLSLWKGLVPSMWRDAPFSGIYWMSYEYWKDRFIKQRMSNKVNNDNTSEPGSFDLWVSSFQSGALSGILATFCTQPFDVMKTRRQASLVGIGSASDLQNKRLVHFAKHIYKTEGLTGFYVGMPARITRVPISCAIMVSTYELGKIMLKNTSSTNAD